MFLNRGASDYSASIYRWLLSNKQQVASGSAKFCCTQVDEQTELRQFTYVVSAIFFTWEIKSPHMIPCEHNGYLNFASSKYAIISLLFGWWGFPFGPLLTIPAVFNALAGGSKHSAVNLIFKMEHGWNAPMNASSKNDREAMVDFTEDALNQLARIRLVGGFSSSFAVRLAPDDMSTVRVSFDYPVSDDMDWSSECNGIQVLIDKRDELKLLSKKIHFDGTNFTANNPDK